MTTLQELFERSRGAPITIDDSLVHSYFSRPVENASVHELRFVSDTIDLPQFLSFSVDGGTIRYGDSSAKEMAFWVRHAPAVMTFRIEGLAQTPSRLWIRNGWEEPSGYTSTLTGNAGMIAIESQDRTILRCSHGMGPVNFENLVAELRWDTGAEGGRTEGQPQR